MPERRRLPSFVSTTERLIPAHRFSPKAALACLRLQERQYRLSSAYTFTRLHLMLSRSFLFAVCALMVPACTTYQPVTVDGKTPFYVMEAAEIPKVISRSFELFGRYSKEFEAATAKEDGQFRGKADFSFNFKSATGRTLDGRTVNGVVLLEKVRIRGKGNPVEKQRAVDLMNRLRADILAELKSSGKQVWVDSYTLH